MAVYKSQSTSIPPSVTASFVDRTSFSMAAKTYPPRIFRMFYIMSVQDNQPIYVKEFTEKEYNDVLKYMSAKDVAFAVYVHEDNKWVPFTSQAYDSFESVSNRPGVEYLIEKRIDHKEV